MVENGAWRDASTLDFGAAINKATVYYSCKHCGKLLIVSESTCGTICTNCGNYNSLNKEDRLVTVPSDDENKGPHVANWELIKYRKGMEKQAENWKKKQEAKVASNNGKPIRHGPRINGERTK